MSTTTIESIIRSANFDERIAALRDVSGEHSDPEQVAICIIALEGEPDEGARERFAGLPLNEREVRRLDAMTRGDARRECARVILETEAQVDA